MDRNQAHREAVSRYRTFKCKVCEHSLEDTTRCALLPGRDLVPWRMEFGAQCPMRPAKWNALLGKMVSTTVAQARKQLYTKRIAICSDCKEKPLCANWNGVSRCVQSKILRNPDEECPVYPPKWVAEENVK